MSAGNLTRPLAVLFGLLAFAAPSTAAEPDFNREVRPILAKHCLKCHGPDDHARQGELRVDVRESALKPAESGAKAIVPGKPQESELLVRVRSSDEDVRMPPPHTNDMLTASEIDLLERWIAAGARYENHWAFEPVRRPSLPAVKAEQWPRSPIDWFVLARLEAAGLAPSPEADRHALVRRVHLDLIGLPPTPEEVERFVLDSDPQAYEKLVDRLLASPHYGERWARRWLDLARYSDTNGYEKDRQRPIWPWRDWVIQALNADMPFDRFTIEQIAGDMLPSATLDQRVATGFHRNTMLNEEGGIDPLEFRFYAMTDRVATTGAVWLGLTLQCAQCHTHKFDPIPHRDYYRLMAMLDNADEPELEVPQPKIVAERERLEKRIAELETQLPEHYPPALDFDWHAVPAEKLQASRSRSATVRRDATVDFAPAAGDDLTTTLMFDSDLVDVRAVRLELLTKESRRGSLGELTVSAQATGAAPLPLRVLRAEANALGSNKPRYEATLAKAFDGQQATAFAVEVAAPGEALTFVLDEPKVKLGAARWTIALRHPAGDVAAFDELRVRLGTVRPNSHSPRERTAELLARQFRSWLEAASPGAVAWRPVRPTEVDSNLPDLTVLDDNSVLSRGDITKSDTYRVTLGGPFRNIRALRLEALPDEGLPERGPGRIYYEGPIGDFFLSELTVRADGRPVKFARATESFAALPDIDPKNPQRLPTRAAEAIDGEPSSGWSINGGQGRAQYAVFTLAEPLAAADKLDVQMLFERHYACGLGRFRLSVTDETPSADAARYPDEIETILARPEAMRSEAERQALLRYYLNMAPELAGARLEIDALRRQLPKNPVTLVLRERPADEPRPTFVRKRGEYLQPLEKVEPGTFGFLPPLPPGTTPDRLALARWLVDARNPLVGRVTVNRHWAAFFGRGIVRTLEDFGYQGSAPTHPELLDWLAAEFVTPSDSGTAWSMKRLHRMIVTSATYRQASRLSPTLAERDPENALLARGPRFRLEAELIRDACLKASGLLSEMLGGPSVFPPQPESVTEAAYGSYKWTASSGADRYRRSLYTFGKRTAPFAMYAAFDAPSGELCTPRRDVSNTPLQSLTLLNDAMFLEAATAFGRQLAGEPGDAAGKVERLFYRVLSRPPTIDEQTMLLRYYQDELKRLQASAKPDIVAPPEATAWMLTARVLLNLDETITKH